ncbi:MAG: hypothetical protein Q7V05_04105 [Methanoregula sp.]|nr:hypothetical protein [Methanoregula sp.]
MDTPAWYEIVDKDAPLYQGDILFSIPLILTKDDPTKETIEVEVEDYQGIIVSQTCDLTCKGIDVVLFCPIIPLNEFVAKKTKPENKKEIIKIKNDVRAGRYVAYYLLNQFNQPGLPDDYFVVDLKNPRSIPFEHMGYIKDRTPVRPRLNTPYREHLSQAFARVFMRVGLPDSIPEFIA